MKLIRSQQNHLEIKNRDLKASRMYVAMMLLSTVKLIVEEVRASQAFRTEETKTIVMTHV